jgi:hypothetical protein
MKGLVLSRVVGSMRQVLAIVVALLTIAGTAYLVRHKLSNPDNYRYWQCFSPAGVFHGWPPPCAPPARAVWQIPLAIVIGVGGLGAAALITTRPRRPRQLPTYRPPA